MGDFIRRHWLSLSALLGALGLVFFVGFGLGQRWGAEQWGPFAEWLAGALTLAAVVVALREARRGQWDRAVDHELQRRRECVKALGDLWAVLRSADLPFRTFTSSVWNQTEPFELSDFVTTSTDFATSWLQKVETPLLSAVVLLQDTPLERSVALIDDKITEVRAGFKTLQIAVIEQRKPDVSPLDDAWQAVIDLRAEHTKLARQHFSPTLSDVEGAVRRRRKRYD